MGCTAFRIPDRFAHGLDIDKFLEDYSGYNVLRVFLYTPKDGWKDKYWDIPEANKIIEFCNYVKDKGFYVEITLATDNDSSKVDQLKNVVKTLNGSNVNNVFLEAVNEPFVKGPDDKLDPSILKNALSGSRFIYTSGIYQYEYLDRFYGKYAVDHSPRDGEWPRKAKDLEDYTSKFKMPAVQDEPIRPETADFNTLDAYTYGALSSLTGNGCTCHLYPGDDNTFASPMNNDQKAWSAAMLKGLNVYPLDAQLGSYEHLRDLEEVDPDGNPTKALRVFAKGSYVIVVRPKNFTAPNNWKKLDDFGICYVR